MPEFNTSFCVTSIELSDPLLNLSGKWFGVIQIARKSRSAHELPYPFRRTSAIASGSRQREKRKMISPIGPRAQVLSNLEQRNALVMSQMTEVHFIARRIYRRIPSGIALEDLVHSGVLGLLEATQKYDATKNIQFKTFAQFRIRGAILDSLRQLDRASRRLRAKSRQLNIASEQLSLRLGRLPTEDEIACEIGLELAVLRKLTVTLRGLESVDQHLIFGNELSGTHDLIESAPTKPEESPLARCQRSEMNRHLGRAMLNLSAREKRVLYLYYFQQRTMQEIASVLGLKSSRISQIHASILAKLRVQLKANEVQRSIKTQIAVPLTSQFDVRCPGRSSFFPSARLD
jgi:RNA polymerase sigma factor FliA